MAKKNKKLEDTSEDQQEQSSAEVIEETITDIVPDVPDREESTFSHLDIPEGSLVNLDMTADRWFHQNQEFVSEHHRNPMMIIRKFCNEMKYVVPLECDLIRISPRKNAEDVCRILYHREQKRKYHG